MKLVKNSCFGGFGLSDNAYEKLIEYGVPVGKYHEEPRNPKTGLYDIPVPENEGNIIYDRTLEDLDDKSVSKEKYIKTMGRYWEVWIEDDRTNPLLVKVVEELGKKASGPCANLEVVDIPDGIEYEIDEYDGIETIREKHRTW